MMNELKRYQSDIGYLTMKMFIKFPLLNGMDKEIRKNRMDIGELK